MKINNLCFMNEAHLGLIHCHQQYFQWNVTVTVSFEKGSEKKPPLGSQFGHVFIRAGRDGHNLNC